MTIYSRIKYKPIYLALNTLHNMALISISRLIIYGFPSLHSTIPLNSGTLNNPFSFFLIHGTPSSISVPMHWPSPTPEMHCFLTPTLQNTPLPSKHS